jgi:hypothetical protein
MLPLLDCVSGKLQEHMDKLTQGAFFGPAEKQQLTTFMETKGHLAALVTVTGLLDAQTGSLGDLLLLPETKGFGLVIAQCV